LARSFPNVGGDVESRTGRRVMISCGEASGDLYAGALVRALRARDPQVQAFGFGGRHMAAAGADLIGDYARFAVTGLVEAISVVPRSFTMLRTLRDAAIERKPDVFVAIDFPDFNLRLLPGLHDLGVPIVYYISPQLWAWRPGRIEQIRRDVSKMLVIFPFEEEIYVKAGVPVELVGHPLVELASASQPRDQWLRARGLDPLRPVVALLPGSRPNEIRLLLAVLVDAALLIARRVPGVQFVIARAPSLPDSLFAAARSSSVPIAIAERETDDVLASADVVVTASGTATVQTAIHGRPMVIVYKVAGLTYALGRRFVKVANYGMVNLIAGRQIVPELIQDACTPERIAAETVSLLTDEPRAAAMRADIADVRAKLGGPGASDRAAMAILSVADRDGRR
jgi:lipid-A-disaccharide synthase